jgi:small subunit ribosomal protein S18
MADEVKQQPAATTGSDTPSAPASTSSAPTSTPSTGGGGYQRPAYGARREGGGSGPRPGGPRPGGGGREGGGPGGRKFFRRKKVCKFCVEKIDAINYKDVRLLSQFVAEKGKIVPRRLTGVCTPHQRRVSAAIKQARNIALLPFAARG